MSRPRVVVTGLGAVTPLGTGVARFWDGLRAGRSGVRRITRFDASQLPCQVAGEIPDFDPLAFMERKQARRLPRVVQIALAAAWEAVGDAGLPVPLPVPERAGVVFGTAIGGLDLFIEGTQVLRTRGLSRVNPFTVPAGLPNMPAFAISQAFQCLGPSATLTTACATGTQAVGEAAELIRRGDADVVIAGGTESLITDFAIAGFAAMRALPTSFNQAPERASRPFDAHREGFVFSEGAGALVLERLEHAVRRNAPIYGEVVGYALTSDGFHMAALDPRGDGAVRAMQGALCAAGLTPTEVEYINAHGTGTRQNDRVETLAIRRVFGDYADRLPVSSIKSMIGHAMGASGALEAIAALLAIRHHCLPPTINYETPDPECDLDYVPNQARPAHVRVVLSNSFGLGGQNACLVLKACEESL